MAWSDLRKQLLTNVLGVTGELCVVPIWPVFADKIYCGIKRFEFRKRIPRLGVATFLIYETAPISAITGCFIAGDVVTDAPENLWAATDEYAGISEQDFFGYYASCKIGVAISIRSVQRFESPIFLVRFGCNPPQSYVYI